MEYKRLVVGMDGTHIYVALGQPPVWKSHFLQLRKNPSKRTQVRIAVDQWYELYPEEGKLPFDVVDGLYG